jgi:hypothetical protein
MTQSKSSGDVGKHACASHVERPTGAAAREGGRAEGPGRQSVFKKASKPPLRGTMRFALQTFFVINQSINCE